MLAAAGHRVRWGVAVLLLGVAVAGVAQVRGRISARYEHEMQDPVDDPPDAGRRGELMFGRLRFRSPLDGGGFGRYARWGIDANKGDRLFIAILQRLTRIDVAPVENIVDVDSDEIFNFPFLFAVSVGDWRLSPTQAARLGEYLRRGGFLLVDDFHNEREWANFIEGIRQMGLAGVPEDLADSASAFHVVFNLKERVRVPGANVVHGSGIERGGAVPYWRGISDDKGRMQVAISFNQDMGDGWEFADDPDYPEHLSSQAARLGTNYVVYAMTH
jgi:hypothetical protein